MTDSKNKNQQHTRIVGVGASAGGLEALQSFFSNLQDDLNVCYVVAQHVSPDFKSMMPELLGKHTKMPISVAKDGVKIEPNVIYIMPARTNLMVADGRLITASQMPQGVIHLPIDNFFNSLANDQKQRAIAVVLSGTGSDGSRGVKSIREHGGFVIVQSPETAQFNGMPLSAAATGAADIVIPTQEMGKKISDLLKHPITRPNPADEHWEFEVPLESQTARNIFDTLKARSSIDFSQYKPSTVARRIQRRMAINRYTELAKYKEFLLSDVNEQHILSKELLIGVTQFMRDDKSFKVLIEEVIPQLAEYQGELRVWVAGCSTGEEAYSISMLIHDYFATRNITRNYKIFATDIDPNAISTAAAGCYNAIDIELLKPKYAERYFERHGDVYRVKPFLRQTIVFAVHNMISDPPFSNLDLVTCRNVLIYFQKNTQKLVMNNLFFSLKTYGFLFLGNSESPNELSAHLKTISEREKIYQKNSDIRLPMTTPAPKTASIIGQELLASEGAQTNLSHEAKHSSSGWLQYTLERIVNECSPPSIIINHDLEALHIIGDIQKFTKGIQPGKISYNIKDILIPELLIAATTAINRCVKEKQDVFYKDVSIDSPNIDSIINLQVLYVQEKSLLQQPFIMVLQFETSSEDNNRHELVQIEFDELTHARKRILELEGELARHQEKLQVTIEELETTNEELQSANEELMSSNEELQSTNEELQSVNEELYTVNSEYQEKILELTEVNNDLDSVFNSTDMGIVFLDDKLAIRRYTEKTKDYINIVAKDIDRPIHHLSHKMLYDNFLIDLSKVLQTGRTQEKDLKTSDGHSIWVRLTAYRSAHSDNIEGVLVTITDISRLRFVEDALKAAQEALRESILDKNLTKSAAINRATEVGVLILDDDKVDRQKIRRMFKSLDGRKLVLYEASNIKEALAIVRQQSVQICFVDYNLGSQSAKDFTYQLEINNAEIPVVLLSGFSEAGLDGDFIKNSVFDFLNKDELNSQLLERSIDYVLERNAIQQLIADA